MNRVVRSRRCLAATGGVDGSICASLGPNRRMGQSQCMQELPPDYRCSGRATKAPVSHKQASTSQKNSRLIRSVLKEFQIAAGTTESRTQVVAEEHG